MVGKKKKKRGALDSTKTRPWDGPLPASGLSFLICEMWDYSALGSHPAPSLRVPRSRPGTRRTGAGCGPGARADAALDGRAHRGGAAGGEELGLATASDRSVRQT